MSGRSRCGPEGAPPAGGARLRSPAFERNFEPIRAALAPRLAGRRGVALELGSGPGEHALALARAFPDLDWVPSDPVPAHRASVAAWGAEGPENLRPPRDLDAAGDWPGAVADLGPLALVLAINVIHIAPWPVAEGIVAGAGRALGRGGLLVLYGPFLEPGRETAPSNLAFHGWLRAENPDWGLRDLGHVATLAEAAGLAGPEVARLPANNLLVAFTRG